MKSTYSTQEGVKMNSDLDFGNTDGIVEQFHPLMNLLVTIFDEEFNYFYRLTDDNYIQIAYSYSGSPIKIIAQYKLRFQDFKENITFIVKNYIEANSPYNGYPTFYSSPIFTKQEFDTILNELKSERAAISKKSFQNITPLITYLKDNNLNPIPSGESPTNWRAQCPSKRGHFIEVSTKTDTWGCGYCRRKGTQTDLENWLLEKSKK